MKVDMPLNKETKPNQNYQIAINYSYTFHTYGKEFKSAEVFKRHTKIYGNCITAVSHKMKSRV